jgi:hypothetical protein
MLTQGRCPVFSFRLTFLMLPYPFIFACEHGFQTHLKETILPPIIRQRTNSQKLSPCKFQNNVTL